MVVTRDFGHQQLGSASERTLREDQTVMRMLQSDFDVETRFGGGFVQSIDGLAGRGAGGQRDWFYFVNGVEADVGAADYELSPGDRVQWDYRDWRRPTACRRSSAPTRSRCAAAGRASVGRCGSSARTPTRTPASA